MKKVISGLVVGLAALMMVAGTSFASGNGYTHDEWDVDGVAYATGNLDTWSPRMDEFRGGEDFTWNGGEINYTADVFAKGNVKAEVDASGFGGTDRMAFHSQNEVNGGELSKAFSKTTGSVSVEGSAYGKDQKWYKGFDDTADVQLSVFGDLRQENGVYSDDKKYDPTHPMSEAWGTNYSTITFSASDGDHSDGWFSSRARANEDLAAAGKTFGASKAYAKTTNTKAFVESSTFNTGSAWLENDSYGDYCGHYNRGPELDIVTFGTGRVGGMASLPTLGYASYGANFEYTGGNNAYGQAGGTATVEKTGNYSVTSSVSAYSKVGIRD